MVTHKTTRTTKATVDEKSLVLILVLRVISEEPTKIAYLTKSKLYQWIGFYSELSYKRFNKILKELSDAEFLIVRIGHILFSVTQLGSDYLQNLRETDPISRDHHSTYYNIPMITNWKADSVGPYTTLPLNLEKIL